VCVFVRFAYIYMYICARYHLVYTRVYIQFVHMCACVHWICIHLRAQCRRLHMCVYIQFAFTCVYVRFVYIYVRIGLCAHKCVLLDSCTCVCMLAVCEHVTKTLILLVHVCIFWRTPIPFSHFRRANFCKKNVGSFALVT